MTARRSWETGRIHRLCYRSSWERLSIGSQLPAFPGSTESLLHSETMSRIRIFVSFDGDHDADLHDLLHAQSMRPGAGFEFSARSQGGMMTDAWTAGCRNRIGAADEVVVICGEHTNVSLRVAAELRIAQELNKPYLLLWGRRELMCTKPDSAKRTDAMYSWTRESLEGQMSATIRNSKPLEVPESCKRP